MVSLIFCYYAAVEPIVLIAASILSADPTRLKEEIASIEPFVDWLQIDVMDGQFVPNTAFPIEIVRTIRTKLPLDIHLMVEDPVSFVSKFLVLEPVNITFHAEAVPDAEGREALIRVIHKGGANVGVAINPETPLSAVEDILGEIDLLLVMSVHPGRGGQAFIPSVLAKVTEARRKYPDLMIQVDGGIDDQTAPLCIRAGANNLVAGSFILRAADRAKAVASLQP